MTSLDLSDPNLPAALDLAVAAAREAGDILRRLGGQPVQVLSAEGRDIKTQADRDAETAILARLRDASPWPILAEESGDQGVPDVGPFWVVDPLDGTLNFARGIPLATVAIALMEADRPLLGVIYDFYRDELFRGLAQPGAGLWEIAGGQHPLSVSAVSDPRQAILATGFPTNRDYSEPALREMIGQIQRFKKVRMLGSAAWMLAAVACGRVDAYAEDDLYLWDVAAGVALVQAAGGYVELNPSPRGRWARRVRVASRKSLWRPPA
ncbi:MAG TPA: inositol monophosphatase family protein [Candidatus Sumerlaeota bacterium]|nr:inositol monophosphatase family protein [Candidatus Sumerlaeota bacterium]